VPVAEAAQDRLRDEVLANPGCWSECGIQARDVLVNRVRAKAQDEQQSADTCVSLIGGENGQDRPEQGRPLRSHE